MDWSRYIGDWDTQEWMEEHGEWVSSQWDEERAERDEAREALAEALRAAADAAEGGDDIDWAAVEAARERLDAADEAMADAVEPDEGDYIAEGTIDPDGVSDSPGTRVWSDSWQGWDCQEGEDVYVAAAAEDGGIRVVHNWWRAAYGPHRHARDLWRVAEVVTDGRDIAEILDAVAPRVARDIWADLRAGLGAATIAEIAEALDADRRHELGLDEAEEDEDVAEEEAPAT